MCYKDSVVSPSYLKLLGNKNFFPLFDNCSRLDLKNKLAKMSWTQPLTYSIFMLSKF